MRFTMLITSMCGITERGPRTNQQKITVTKNKDTSAAMSSSIMATCQQHSSDVELTYLGVLALSQSSVAGCNVCVLLIERGARMRRGDLM
jgi:hypothetical protein